MIVIGLTGSIGMGKSTVLSMFGDLGAATWCADDAVHRLYTKGGAAVDPVGAFYPDAIAGGAVDRTKLAGFVLGDPVKLKKLETIVHPLVALDRQEFLKRSADEGKTIAVLDIPLLFESGYEKGFDAVVVVSAPKEIQRERTLSRPGMTEEKFEAILAQQTPDEEKRARADYVIDTGKPLEETREQVSEVYEKILERKHP
jgi:dephospho-CoA kinase